MLSIPLKIGPHVLNGRVVLAPMSGITDAPFRNICLDFGASATYSEMVTSDIRLWQHEKTQRRLNIQQQSSPRCIQILGIDPVQMARAAKMCVDLGADVIDINMGCPAKKVCHQSAGSALLKDEQLVREILSAVVKAVDVPVTLKYRTGWSHTQKNAVEIAHIAENSGVQALTLHGRTASDKFNGHAEHFTVAAVVAAVQIPVIANGDICSGPQAKKILEQTGADGIMIGRGAQGRPWIFREVQEFLSVGSVQTLVSIKEICSTILRHVHSLYAFYGELTGVRVARKHLGWYLDNIPNGHVVKHQMQRCTTTSDQIDCVNQFFEQHLFDQTCVEPTHNEQQLRLGNASLQQLDPKTIAKREVLAA